MKKYIKPELTIELVEIEDVITTSEEDTSSGRFLKTIVNGNKGDPYGSQEVSIFD